MFPVPINDDVRRQTFWVGTLLLILLNLWAFEFELSIGWSSITASFQRVTQRPEASRP
jgi:membrane associated rhomboid family serine protease